MGVVRRSKVRHLRLGIVDGCCSTTNRVSEGDLQGFNSTPDDVTLTLSKTAGLLAFIVSLDLSQYSAMLDLAQVKGHVHSQIYTLKILHHTIE